MGTLTVPDRAGWAVEQPDLAPDAVRTAVAAHGCADAAVLTGEAGTGVPARRSHRETP
ncbi:hypothetical protein [Kocuria sp.]|jgi:hypothetical protein|uniref:hypothetical protein n=1 Tax=Kocuria sp. TaxID=1871328 RepID=UPI002811D405|nr:hypothetical protein [Kocuria sp.]HST71900.1 hypothetical protein [Kocuria rosea]